MRKLSAAPLRLGLLLSGSSLTAAQADVRDRAGGFDQGSSAAESSEPASRAPGSVDTKPQRGSAPRPASARPLENREGARAASAPAPLENPGGGMPGPAVTETRAGNFFTSTLENGRYELRIALPKDATYDTITIEFDAAAPRFAGPALHGIVDLSNPGSRGRYFAIQHTLLRRAEKGIRTAIDNKIGGTIATRTDVLDAVGDGGADLHYRIEYSTAQKSVGIEITNRKTRARNAFIEKQTNQGAVLVEENDLRDLGKGLLLGIGLGKVYDHGGYYPPYGWSFSDLSIRLAHSARKAPR